MLCISCGRGDRPVFPLPSSLSPNLMACSFCITKYGADNLAREADRLLSLREELDKPRCVNCGAPVLTLPDGREFLYCEECFRFLKEDHKCVVKKLNEN